MQQDFFRYELKETLGVICGPFCNAVYEAGERLIITGALDEIKLWNMRTGDVVSVLRDDTESSHSQVTKLSLHPTNSDIIAAGYEDGSIRLWSIKEKRALVQFNGHVSAITALAFDPYTMRMASGGRDSDIVIWDLVGECGLFRLQGHTGGVTGLKFLSSGQYLLSAARDSLLKVWDLEAQLSVETEVSHHGEISDFCVSLDERVLMTVGADQLLRIFSIDHEILDMLLKSTDSKLSAVKLYGEVPRGTKEKALIVSLHPNHKVISILSADRSLEFFEIRGKEEAQIKLRRKKKHAGKEKVELIATDLFKQLRVYRLSSPAHSFTFGKDTKPEVVKLLVSYNDNRLEELEIPLDQQQETKTLHSINNMGHRSEVKSVCISPDQRLLVSGGPDGAKVWSCEEGTYLRSLGDNEVSGVSCVVFLSDTHVLIGTKKGLLILGDAETGDVIEAYKAHEGNLWSVDVGSDDRTIATASSDKTVKLWELKSKGDKPRLKCIKTLELGEEALVVKTSGDMKLVAVATLDMTIKVFYLDTLKIFLTLFGHRLPVTSIDITPDCKTLVSASLDKSIKLWGLEFGELKKSLLAHSEALTQVRFLPDARAFVSVSKDKQIKMWRNSGNYPLLQRYFDRGHFGEIWGLAVSESYIVTAGHDRSIKIYQLSEKLFILEEEADREADKRLEESLVEGTLSSAEPSKLTVEAMKIGERVVKAIEDADEERLARDEAVAQGRPPTHTVIFASIAKGMQPYEWAIKHFESIPTPDLDQSILLLPSRLIYSLLLYVEQALDTPYIMTACAIFGTLMRLYFHEISADHALKNIIQGIRDKMKRNLEYMSQLYTFNYMASKRIASN